MDSVLMIMTLLCIVSGVFRNSLAPGKTYPAVFAALCALFVYVSGSYAIEINKLSVEKALEDMKIMQNLNIIVTLHFLLVSGFSASKLKRAFGLHRTWFYRVLEYMPAVLVFPAFFYLHLMLLFSFVGTSFHTIGLVLSIAVAVLMGGGAYGLRIVFPEVELRTSLLLVVELLLFVLLVCSTIFHPAAVLFSPDTPIDFGSLIFMSGVAVLLFLAGFFRLGDRFRARICGKKNI